MNKQVEHVIVLTHRTDLQDRAVSTDESDIIYHPRNTVSGKLLDIAEQKNPDEGFYKLPLIMNTSDLGDVRVLSQFSMVEAKQIDFDGSILEPNCIPRYLKEEIMDQALGTHVVLHTADSLESWNHLAVSLLRYNEKNESSVLINYSDKKEPMLLLPVMYQDGLKKEQRGILTHVNRYAVEIQKEDGELPVLISNGIGKPLGYTRINEFRDLIGREVSLPPISRGQYLKVVDVQELKKKKAKGLER